MCYSLESSIKTTTISLISIVYLLTSNIPKFKWLYCIDVHVKPFFIYKPDNLVTQFILFVFMSVTYVL